MAMLAAVIVMFILTTTDVGVSWRLALDRTTILYKGNSDAFVKALYPKFLFHLVNNFTADVLLVIRCYVVWGRKKIVLVFASLILIIGTVFGIISEGTTSVELKKFIGVYIGIILILNIILTILTAGRIWWIAREVKQIMGHEMASQYHYSIAILIESGLIYTAANILVVILAPTRFVLMAAAIAIRVVCIMPILIIVQIALGQATKDIPTAVSRYQAETQQIVVLDTIISGGRYESETEYNTHQRAPSDIENPCSEGHVVGGSSQNETDTDAVDSRE
ncbi:hypothetical protein B0H34DRAFT_530179 [Crassisporium funariophilum]|nr:hypothetical protein B0H34DRAFT_530179 [Crassisporium funariophilum]